MPYIPHTTEDIQDMLNTIGVDSMDNLFNEIPSALLQHKLLDNIPEGSTEMQMLQHANAAASHNKPLACFVGAGSYDHHIPAAVWDIASRGEFLTAYTPYQAEASQGTLQLLYEFQTMMAELTGMDMANASMYDGATALAEAILMAIRANRHSSSARVLIPASLHPLYRQTIDTIIRNQHIEVITLPFDHERGTTSIDTLKQYDGEDIAALVIPQPNFFGCLEDIHALTRWAEDNHAISIACVNPMSLALLSSPGTWGGHGVDIVCGEGQPLGVPMASGGPYFGFLSTKKNLIRQMPGRIVGRTVDTKGQVGYTLTLQAREQHIRRAKATSNICTNQGLLVTAATVYMSLLGTEGLANVAKTCYANTSQLVDALVRIPGVKRTFSTPCFHETLLSFDKPIDKLLSALKMQGIWGGYTIHQHYSQLPANALLVCVTETRTQEEITRYIDTVTNFLARD